MSTTSECTYDDCHEPVRAKGLCARHYFREAKRRQKGHKAGAYRPPLDETVYKLRLVTSSGSKTTYYSDRRQAYKVALDAAEHGNLLYFASYSLADDLIYGTGT